MVVLIVGSKSPFSSDLVVVRPEVTTSSLTYPPEACQRTCWQQGPHSNSDEGKVMSGGGVYPILLFPASLVVVRPEVTTGQLISPRP